MNDSEKRLQEVEAGAAALSATQEQLSEAQLETRKQKEELQGAAAKVGTYQCFPGVKKQACALQLLSL